MREFSDADLGRASGSSLCTTFPDSTCVLQPSGVFSSWGYITNTTTNLDWFNGCSGDEKYSLDFKFRQSFPKSLPVNFTVAATFGCEQVLMESNGTGFENQLIAKLFNDRLILKNEWAAASWVD